MNLLTTNGTYASVVNMATNQNIHTVSTGKRINPSKPETAEYFDPEQTCYILQDGDTVRAVTSFGHLGDFTNEDFIEVGDRVDVNGRGRHFTVIGIVEFDGSGNRGAVPTKTVPHHVVK